MDKVLCLCRSHDQGGISPKKLQKTAKNRRGGQIPKKVSPKIYNNQEGVANRAESVVEQPVVETDVARRKSGQVITTLFSGGSLCGGNIDMIY